MRLDIQNLNNNEFLCSRLYEIWAQKTNLNSPGPTRARNPKLEARKIRTRSSSIWGNQTLVSKRHLVIPAEDLSSSLSDCVEVKPIVVKANFCPFPTSLVLEDHSASQMN